MWPKLLNGMAPQLMSPDGNAMVSTLAQTQWRNRWEGTQHAWHLSYPQTYHDDDMHDLVLLMIPYQAIVATCYLAPCWCSGVTFCSGLTVTRRRCGVSFSTSRLDFKAPGSPSREGPWLWQRDQCFAGAWVPGMGGVWGGCVPWHSHFALAWS